MSRSHLESEAELRFLQSRVAGKQWGPEQEKRLKLSLGLRLLNFVAFNPCAKHLGLEKTEIHTLAEEAPGISLSSAVEPPVSGPVPPCLTVWEIRCGSRGGCCRVSEPLLPPGLLPLPKAAERLG